MKAITIWQPWASLLPCGAKKYETRSWATSYRGQVAIHAAAGQHVKEWETLDDKTAGLMQEVLGFIELDELPLGCVIATAELIGCHKIVRHGGRGLSSTSPGWLETDSGIYVPTENEILFGDWTPGRYAWELKNMTMLPEPIPAKGKQRLWEWEGL